MGYRSLAACVSDLEQAGHLVRCNHEVDPNLEAAEIQRRLYAVGGPAVLFTQVKGTQFPMLSNLFGTGERLRFIFRDALRGVEALLRAKADPAYLARHPLKAAALLPTLSHVLPRTVSRAAVTRHTTTISHLPQLVSWPEDGGPFITLPQVYSEHPDQPGLLHSNLGMYRVQLAGNGYVRDQEVGLHYQIHRGIGIHRTAALAKGQPLSVNIFVGGPPAMALAAVMPLPEGIAELLFAGALNRRRIRMLRAKGALAIHADADFCIQGTIDPTQRKPEGPFGDHLGYYALQHDFPVLKVHQVYHREGAIWPFTTVGRPPQEDSSFGEFIHKLTAPLVPSLLPGIQGVHAVDAAGVHPLLLALGSERYEPQRPSQRPAELLTQANAILGHGQMSLAKYLLIAATEDARELNVQDTSAFLQHVLARVQWQRDLHFQTRTTIDTLDYSGDTLNEGSKLVIAARGPAQRKLPRELPADLKLPAGFTAPRICLPGVLAIQAPTWSHNREAEGSLKSFCQSFTQTAPINAFPLIVLVDDSDFTSRTLGNFLWVTFTRSNPAPDIDGIDASTVDKHWGCRGALVIDARIKAHHAPPLVEDPAVTRRVDALAAPGGPLHGIL